MEQVGDAWIVGAGLHGLIVAFALASVGVPSTVYERGGDAGGIWDI